MYIFIALMVATLPQVVAVGSPGSDRRDVVTAQGLVGLLNTDVLVERKDGSFLVGLLVIAGPNGVTVQFANTRELSIPLDEIVAIRGSRETSVEATPPTAAANWKADYDSAKQLYNDKKFSESAEAFDTWLLRHATAHPEFVNNAAYWKAESYFGQSASLSDKTAKEKALKQAILAYQRVIEDPKSAKNDGALYKIGLAFELLGLKPEAAAFYEELLSKHPNSPVVTDATRRLRALGAARRARDYGDYPQCDTGQRCGHSCISRLETCTK